MQGKKIAAAVVAVSLLNLYPVSMADTQKITAFPGAEGGGMYASGARESVKEIYHVTSLADDGTSGTLRDAVSQSDRIIVFDVAGNIELTNALNIVGDNLTVLGQTAPGDGICIKDNTVGFYGDNVILRYLRFRMGDTATVEDDTVGGRSINNVILDHCSISWSTDECASFYENTNFTMQWCIVSESLKESVHSKGSHGYGGIWGGQNASFHHNLIMHHDSRNPRIATSGIDAAYTDVTKQTDLTDLRNNVVYNWGGNSAYGGENGAPVNLVNCYYKPGPATKHTSRLFQISAKAEGDTTGTNSLNRPGWGTDLYVSGNYVEGGADVTEDNTKGVVTDSNSTKYGVWTDSNITDDEKTVHNRYITEYPITTQTAQDAYVSVLESVGASIVRDSVDTRLINEVKSGTATYGDGIINSPSEVGGYPELNGTKAKDSDNDGIPNEWEDKNGLDKFNASDALETAQSGYLYIEEYANALADGSYVRDVNYDPDVEDYNPTEDPNVTPTPTPEPQKELVCQWIASTGDENKSAGTEFMPGLTGVIQLSRAMTNTVNYSDGSSYAYAITHKDTSGNWNTSTKQAEGCAMKYTATQDGVFTLYAYGVLGTKTFYAVPEGAADYVNDSVYAEEFTGSSVPIICTIDVKEGETYYFFMKGSKARFCAAKLEVYAESKPEPTETPQPFEKYIITNVTFNANTISFNAESVGGATNALAVAAGYDASGRLTAVKTAQITRSGIYDVEISGTDNAVLFVWDGIDTIKPVAKISK